MFTFKLKRLLGVKFLLFIMGVLMAACSEPSNSSKAGDNNNDFVFQRERRRQRQRGDCATRNNCQGDQRFLGSFTIINGDRGEEYYNYAFGYDNPFERGRTSRRREFTDGLEDLARNFLMAGAGAMLCEGQTWLAEEFASGLGFPRLDSDCSHTVGGNTNRLNRQRVNTTRHSFPSALVFQYDNRGLVYEIEVFVDYDGDRRPDDSLAFSRVNNRLFRTPDGQVELWFSSGPVQLSWHDGGGDNPFRQRVVFGEFRQDNNIYQR